MAKEKLNFEDSLNRLEEISKLLESEEITLKDMINLYEEGMKLANFCSTELKNAELQIEKINSTFLNAE